jgi:hypothetical protein
MSLKANGQPFAVSVCDSEAAGEQLIFTFTPEGAQQQRHGSRSQFTVAAQQAGDRIDFDWSATPDAPESAIEQMQQEATQRIKARAAWMEAVKALVDQVEVWAGQLEWSTRRVEKKIEDTWIGNHRLPALLMQADTCRIMLEPVGRLTAGAEGVVDLYLLPAYDDIASFYYYDHRWNLHYAFPDSEPAASVREAPAVPLTLETFETVLAELRKSAA